MQRQLDKDGQSAGVSLDVKFTGPGKQHLRWLSVQDSSFLCVGLKMPERKLYWIPPEQRMATPSSTTSFIVVYTYSLHEYL